MSEQTLAAEIAEYAETLDGIASRWGHADDAHTRQVARRLRRILAKHEATEGAGA